MANEKKYNKKHKNSAPLHDPSEAALKNTVYTAEITDRTNLGFGVCRIGGKVVFVPRTAAGDKAAVRIIKSASDYCVGKVEDLTVCSPRHIKNDCPAYIRCGGCVHRDIEYSYELEIKENRVRAAFEKAGILQAVEDFRPIRYTGQTDGYRNKLQMPVGKDRTGKLTAGFYAQKTHEIVPVEHCRLQTPQTAEMIPELLSMIGKEKICREAGELLRHVYLRTGDRGTSVCLVCRSLPKKIEILAEEFVSRFPSGAVSGFSVNINAEDTNVILGKEYVTLSGESCIRDTLCGLDMEVSPASFYQVNRPAAELGYSLIAEAAELRPGQKVCDIYCGIGSIGLSLASLCPGIVLSGLEIVPEAVEDAKANAERNGIAAEFFCADAADPHDTTAQTILRGADCVVLDPPRKGCSPELLRSVASSGAEKICYLSCDPDTLARDCALLSREYGYAVKTVTPVDFFPRTSHVETVVLLARQ